MTASRRDKAEAEARRKHALRQREGHKTADWEGLSELMREELILQEMKPLIGAPSARALERNVMGEVSWQILAMIDARPRVTSSDNPLHHALARAAGYLHDIEWWEERLAAWAGGQKPPHAVDGWTLADDRAGLEMRRQHLAEEAARIEMLISRPGR